MLENNIPNLNEIAEEYLNVIKAFKNRSDVQNGHAIGYRENQDPNGKLLLKNKPHSIGEGLTTTGWCVSVSQTFNNDNAFKHLLAARNSYAKLISIDLKEQFYGRCYNGSPNTWHTAILVSDSGINFVIDLTVAQMGNRYVEKFLWDFRTWEKTFRSPLCKHIITDANNNVLTFINKTNTSNINITYNDSVNVDTIISALSKNLHLTDDQIKTLANFFVKDINIYNTKLLNGSINRFDSLNLKTINTGIEKLALCKFNTACYSVIEFENKNNLLAFLKLFNANDFRINQYVLFFNNMKDACDAVGVNLDKINRQNVLENDTHYLVFEFFNSLVGYDTAFLKPDSGLIPLGTEFTIEKENIFNGMQILDRTKVLTPQKTNTIYIRI